MPNVGRFRYLEAPPSPTARSRGVLLLLHAFPLSARMWEPQFTALAEHGWRVIAPHVRGVDGGAGEPPAQSIDDYAADVVDLLDALRIDDAVVGGCSMGGYLAFTVLRLASNYVRGLLLVDTRAQADAPDALEGRKKLIKTAEEQGPSAVLDEMLSKLLGETTRRERHEVVERVKSIAMRNSTESVVGMIRALMSRKDAVALLPTINVPTLIVVGEEDTITPLKFAQEMHDGIRGSELVVIPRVGHLPNLEEPDTFNAIVTRFLDHRV